MLLRFACTRPVLGAMCWNSCPFPGRGEWPLVTNQLKVLARVCVWAVDGVSLRLPAQTLWARGHCSQSEVDGVI